VTDNAPYVPPAGFTPVAGPPPRRSSRGCWIGGSFLALLVALLCCGGGVALVRFGFQIIATEIEEQLADNPKLKEQIGEIQSFETEWSRTLVHKEKDVTVFNVRGDKGEGRITVHHVTNDEGDEEIQSAVLRLSTGESVELVP
jgi:hypothetical protein